MTNFSLRLRKPTPVLVQASLDRLGRRLARARKLREMTQEDLAHLSDVSLSTLRSLEAGADGVALGNLLKVLQGLNLLDQVEDWLDPQRDPETVNFVERRLGGR
jgi:transcriptional regulator with XRE-family HTH domain